MESRQLDALFDSMLQQRQALNSYSMNTCEAHNVSAERGRHSGSAASINEDEGDDDESNYFSRRAERKTDRDQLTDSEWKGESLSLISYSVSTHYTIVIYLLTRRS
jgi:hypothetical protein